MKSIIALALLGSLLLGMSASQAERGVGITEVIFEQSELGIEPYRSRLLLGRDFLRLDDGTDSSDFILFDRESAEIHSFNHDDKTHMRIRPRKFTAIDFDLTLTREEKALSDAPSVNGQQPVQYRFLANGELCRQSVNVRGLLPDFLHALQRYEQMLVEQSKSSLEQLPASLKTDCYMANNFLHASDYLRVGFPLQVLDYDGKQQKLLSYRQISGSGSLFEFPTGYRQYDPSDKTSVRAQQ